MKDLIKKEGRDQYEITIMVYLSLSLSCRCPFIAFIDGYRNRLNYLFPLIGQFVDSFFKPLFDVDSHWRYVDFMLNFILKISPSKSLRSMEILHKSYSIS
jgi:hypothetical protein